MAVKDWLVKTLDLDEKRVAVRGFGKTTPLVAEGSKEEQAPNRRVEIKMRKERPANEVNEIGSVAPAEPTEPKPARAIPIEEDPPTLPDPPRAIVEPEDPEPAHVPPRAIPVE